MFFMLSSTLCSEKIWRRQGQACTENFRQMRLTPPLDSDEKCFSTHDIEEICPNAFGQGSTPSHWHWSVRHWHWSVATGKCSVHCFRLYYIPNLDCAQMFQYYSSIFFIDLKFWDDFFTFIETPCSLYKQRNFFWYAMNALVYRSDMDGINYCSYW